MTISASRGEFLLSIYKCPVYIFSVIQQILVGQISGTVRFSTQHTEVYKLCLLITLDTAGATWDYLWCRPKFWLRVLL